MKKWIAKIGISENYIIPVRTVYNNSAKTNCFITVQQVKKEIHMGMEILFYNASVYDLDFIYYKCKKKKKESVIFTTFIY